VCGEVILLVDDSKGVRTGRGPFGRRGAGRFEEVVKHRESILKEML
jgi:hypothetical protein